MNRNRRIYLDNAATSWPKPSTVYGTVDHYQRHIGAPAGRGAYQEAIEIDRQIGVVRRSVAKALGIGDPKHLVFTSSGTDSLHLAILGAVRPGDHVVTTVCEHNSVLRPLRTLAQDQGVRVTRVACDRQGFVAPEQIVRALEPRTRLVAMIHASNVTGVVQPIGEVGLLLQDHPALLLVDAAQTAGCLPIAVDELGADLLAAPGHKGLLGPLGTGVLYVAPRAVPLVRAARPGGTGTRSDEDVQPESLPEKFESGNLNVPGLLGLGCGVDYVLRQGIAAIHEQTTGLVRRLADGLAGIDGVTCFGNPNHSAAVAVLSLQISGLDPHEVAGMLEAMCRVQVRAGFHCAARMHQVLGAAGSGGTVRFSPGPFNTPDDIDTAVAAVARLAADRR